MRSGKGCRVGERVGAESGLGKGTDGVWKRVVGGKEGWIQEKVGWLELEAAGRRERRLAFGVEPCWAGDWQVGDLVCGVRRGPLRGLLISETLIVRIV